MEAKKTESFGGLPTDSAFDAAHLEFKLVDQTVVKAARSDLTRPFNEVCSLKPPGTISYVHTCTDHTMSELAQLLQSGSICTFTHTEKIIACA